jgi:MFS family permease
LNATRYNSMKSVSNDQVRHNITVNLLDGSFFGAALGFASFVTIIPLFVSELTNSAVLIGLIPAIHSVGWQLPQLLTAPRVSRLERFRPSVLKLTINERLPFLGLAIVAWYSPSLGDQRALILTFVLLIWQGLGGGLTANAWQSMIAKIIPSDRLGTFFGIQNSSANLLASISAILAGILLARLVTPLDFTSCFLFASIAMGISWIFLSMTRETRSSLPEINKRTGTFWTGLGVILKRDANFRWFLVSRMVSQLATMGFAFYTVYAVRILGIGEATIGLMTGLLMGTQIAANPIMGWFGDRYGHRIILIFGTLAAIASAGLAFAGQGIAGFLVVFILTGIANVASWTTPMAMTLEFGRSEQDRPAYIGLANTIIAPFTFLAPLVGGILADQRGFQATFLLSAIAGLGTLGILLFAVKDPPRQDDIPIIPLANDLFWE